MIQGARILLKEGVLVLLSISFLIAGATENAYARRYFFIQRPKLGLRFSYEYENEIRKTLGEDTKNITQDFEERLTFVTRGWVYHPYLLEFKAEFSPTWRQRRQEIERPDQEQENKSENSYLANYRLNAFFLKQKPYTLHLYGRRDESTIRSSFAERTQTKTDVYGADLDIKYSHMLATLKYSHESRDESGFFISEEETDKYNLYAHHDKGKSFTSLDSSYEDSDSGSGGGQSRTKTSDSYIRNNYDIRGDGNIQLNSDFSYRWTESGSSENSVLWASEKLNWTHRQNLSSRYRASYRRQDTGDFTTENFFLAAGLRHRLYENLTTSFDGSASLDDFSGGSQQTYTADLGIDYQRGIPWGTINLDAGLDLDYTTRDNPEEPVTVPNEPHTLTPSEFAELKNNDVIISSIIVRSANDNGRVPAGFVFIGPPEKTDYDIQVVDSFVRIIANPLSPNMVFPQPVLVEYSFIPDPSFDDVTLFQSYGISTSLWRTLRLSYRFFRGKQHVVAGPTPDNPIDDTVHKAQMNLDWRWTSTELEFEDTDIESGTSSRSWSVRENLSFRPFSRISFNLSGDYKHRKIKDTDEKDISYRLQSRFIWSISRRFRFSAEGFWNDYSGDIQDTVIRGFSATVDWSYRIWNGNIRYSFLDEDNRSSDERREVHYVLCEIVRIPF